MQRPIYLDYAATTPVDERVAKKMMGYLSKEGIFGNPSSTAHIYGYEAREAVETSRQQVAKLINAKASEIVWTSGATEANNLAILGIARANQKRGNHIITAKTEHKAVLDPCKFLEQNGFEVTYLTPNAEGFINIDHIKNAITSKTILVSVMAVNNEIGVVHPWREIGALCRQHNVLFHVDAVQAIGKLPIDVKADNIDLLSISAHKIYGPKGIGALYLRRRPKITIAPLVYGGGHENGLRSGTLATHQIVGIGEACQILTQSMAKESKRLAVLKKALWQGISQSLDAIVLNGDLTHAAPHILNISFKGVDGEALVMALQDLAISTGSACTSASMSTSHVIKALGHDDLLAHSTIRFSLGRFTTKAEIAKAVKLVVTHVQRLRSMSPLWRQ